MFMKNEREYRLLEGTQHGVMKVKSGLLSLGRDGFGRLLCHP